MRKQGHIKRLLFAGLLFAALLPSCSLIHDDDLDCQLYTEEGVPYAYVSIALNTSAATPSTRAGNPTGGEDGDGEEPGQGYENQVNDITLFFYDAAVATNGVNSVPTEPATSIPIVARLYLTASQLTGSETQKQTEAIEVEQLLVNHQYHVLAVVNGGESFGAGFTDLDDLQQATVTILYNVTGTGDNVTYSNFLMSSEDDENYPLHITPSNSATNPAMTTIDVERVTARVDYRAVGDTNTDNVYEIEGVGTAKITGAMLVNTLNETAESYLLKRVTAENAGINTPPTWLGDETYTIETGAATNYVIAPLTTTLNADNASTYFSTANYFPSFDYDNADVWETLFIKGTEITDSDETWLRIGYPKENTAEKADLYYTTGVVFQADFIPIIDGEVLDDNATFFEWNGRIYATVEAAMQAFDFYGWNRIDETKDQWASVTTWDDLRNDIIAGLHTGDPAGYKLFLEKQAKGKDGDIENKDALRWSNYMKTYCYYELDTDGKVTVDMDNNKGFTRSALAPFGLATYYQGICYYTYWIKHANDQITDNDMPFAGGGVMEYGIVRNNIYKLNVTGITQLGDPIPGDRTLLINVSVRNWELIEGEDEIKLQPTTGNE